MPNHFEAQHWVPFPVEQVFRFFANPANLARIMPPSSRTELVRLKLVPPPVTTTSRVTITDQDPIAGPGSQVVTSFRILPVLPFRAQWVALITEFEWNDHFCDVQKKGPFKSFHHRHQLTPQTREGTTGTQVQDVIDYEIGFGLLGKLIDAVFLRPQLHKTFAYRQQALERLLSKSVNP